MKNNKLKVILILLVMFTCVNFSWTNNKYKIKNGTKYFGDSSETAWTTEEINTVIHEFTNEISISGTSIASNAGKWVVHDESIDTKINIPIYIPSKTKKLKGNFRLKSESDNVAVKVRMKLDSNFSPIFQTTSTCYILSDELEVAVDNYGWQILEIQLGSIGAANGYLEGFSVYIDN